eukprot:SAG31_NODE_37662_length_302_cov_1.009852_1_plen_60_part_01
MLHVALLTMMVLGARQYPVPSALPPHGWATVGHKLFIHGCKAEGLFSRSELSLAAKYPLM